MKTEAPERIYNWLDTQMSVARYWGGLTYMGHSYYVAPNEDGSPLVRSDVLEREKREKQAERKAAKQLANLKSQQAQGELL
jgi:urease accessory protein UreF